MNEMNPAIKEFLVESYENLGRLDNEFVALERDPGNPALIGSIFRTIHTIKGSCGFLGFPRLEAVAHAGESLLVKLRDRKLTLSREITDGLLAMVDAVRTMLAQIEATGLDGENDHAELIDELAQLRESRVAAPSTAPTARMAGTPSPAAVPLDATIFAEAGLLEPALAQATKRAEDAEPRRSELVANRPTAPPTPPRSSSAGPASGFAELLPESAVSKPALPSEGDELDRSMPPTTTPVGESTIRIDVGLLDRFMNLVGELVLARNQILQYTAQDGTPSSVAASRQLSLITSELQEAVMRTRMQPIGNIWGKLPRTVRDIATTCGKQVRLTIDGSETELDKTILEAIKDPITHMIRNAVDHGIERPEKRRAAGKPAEGQIALRAFHEGGQVNVEIADDGAGIDLDRIRRKAIQAGLITSDQLAQMTEQSLLSLIFLPGFSTSDRVTQLSGRGVGMDVVKTNIEKLGGTVDIRTTRGAGTTVRIRIPLTLAIIRALTIDCAGERYAIPQVNILELLRLEGDRARRGIEQVCGAPVYRYRGQLLPLVDLRGVFQGETPGDSSAGPSFDADTVNIVVFQADDRPCGLVVDRIRDSQEIVVKPLPSHVKGIPCFAGATLLGDGRVALILDVIGLAQQAGVLRRQREIGHAEPAPPPTAAAAERQSLVLVRGTDGGRMAIPLATVARLEQFDRGQIERVGSCDVVQYRNEILPLVDVAAALRGIAAEPGPAEPRGTGRTDSRQVVVCKSSGRSYGLVVDRILDITEAALEVKGRPGRSRVICTAVVHGQVTELIDVDALLAQSELGMGQSAVPA